MGMVSLAVLHCTGLVLLLVALCCAVQCDVLDAARHTIQKCTSYCDSDVSL